MLFRSRQAKERFEAAALSAELVLLEIDWSNQRVLAAGGWERRETGEE